MTDGFYLDPDFRRDAPSGPHCCRCQKAIDPIRAIQVTVDWEQWEVTEGGSDLIGKDCWRIIRKASDEDKQ